MELKEKDIKLIAQWQKDKVLKAKKEAKANPSLLINWEGVKKNIKEKK
jgi:hypothetical protein